MYSITHVHQDANDSLLSCGQEDSRRFSLYKVAEPKAFWVKTMLAIWLSDLRFALLFGSTATAVDTRLRKYDKFCFSSINMAAMQGRTWQTATVYPTHLVGPLYPLSIFPANSHYLLCVFIIAAVIKKFGCQIYAAGFRTRKRQQNRRKGPLYQSSAAEVAFAAAWQAAV